MYAPLALLRESPGTMPGDPPSFTRDCVVGGTAPGSVPRGEETGGIARALVGLRATSV